MSALMSLLCTSSESSLFVAVSIKHPIPTPDYSQISKELINFYDSAYIKAMDVSGSASKDSAIKVLDVFHKTVRNDGGKNHHILFFWPCCFVFEMTGYRNIVDFMFLCFLSCSARLLR